MDKELHLLPNSLFVTVFRLTLGVGMSPVWFAIITCGEVRAEGPLALLTLCTSLTSIDICAALSIQLGMNDS